jgi:hypothetical protein
MRIFLNMIDLLAWNGFGRELHQENFSPGDEKRSSEPAFCESAVQEEHTSRSPSGTGQGFSEKRTPCRAPLGKDIIRTNSIHANRAFDKRTTPFATGPARKRGFSYKNFTTLWASPLGILRPKKKESFGARSIQYMHRPTIVPDCTAASVPQMSPQSDKLPQPLGPSLAQARDPWRENNSFFLRSKEDQCRKRKPRKKINHPVEWPCPWVTWASCHKHIEWFPQRKAEL